MINPDEVGFTPARDLVECRDAPVIPVFYKRAVIPRP